MILVILGVCIVLFITGLFINNVSRYGSSGEDVGELMMGLFGFASLIVLIVIICLIYSVRNDSTIEDRITMYQEENAKIEQQIDILVKDYQEYERGVFADTTVDSAITLVSLYPELKADQLVSSQLDIYVKNNEQIKQLKLEQINAEVVRWWLYFGGK